MSNYFRNFPVVDYKFGDELTFNQFQHIGTAVDILDQVKEYSVYYMTYNIRNGERPEQLSYQLYGDVNHLSLIHISSPRDRTRSRMPSSA